VFLLHYEIVVVEVANIVFLVKLVEKISFSFSELYICLRLQKKSVFEHDYSQRRTRRHAGRFGFNPRIGRF
jgi:hypothetical protein